MHTTLNSLSLGLTTCGSGNPSSGHKARSARRRSRSRSGRGAMSLGDGDGLRLHKFPSIQMSIAASELSRRRAAHVSSKAHPQKRSARTHARTQHRAVYSTAHRRRRSDRSLRLPEMDSERDKADYGVCSPTVCSSTGAFQAPQPGEDAHRRTAPLLGCKNILRVRGKFPSGQRCMSVSRHHSACACACV